MRRRWSGFSSSLLLTAAALLIPLTVWTRLTAASVPLPPPYPIPGRHVLAEYGGVSASVLHSIYWHGLFGFGDRIKGANIVLIGSSHMQFGLSARQMSDELSQMAGHSVRVFNLGLGCSEGLNFATQLLQRLAPKARVIIGDLYSYSDPPSHCADEAKKYDPWSSYIRVINVWTRFTWDWLLDGYLPKAALRGGSIDKAIRMEPFLNGAVVITDWRFGDVVYFSRATGELFPALNTITGAAPLPIVGDELTQPLPNGRIPPPGGLRNVVAQRHYTLILTYVPFSHGAADANEVRTLQGLLLEPEGRGEPFVDFSDEGLATFDGRHLTGDSRQIATARLIDSIRDARLLAPLLSGGVKPIQQLENH